MEASALIELSDHRVIAEKIRGLSFDEKLKGRNGLQALVETYSRAGKEYQSSVAKSSQFKIVMECSMGAWLAENVSVGGDRTGSESGDTTLTKLGVSKDESSQWQSVAAIPEGSGRGFGKM